MSPTTPPPDGQPPAARIAPRAGYWRFGRYTLDTARRELEHGGHRVRLDARTLAVLECLLEHAGSVVPRDVLIAQAWQRFPVADSAVSKAMRRLRIALGHEAGTVLLTVYGVGYRLALPAEREGADAGPAIVTTPSGPQASTRSSAPAAGATLPAPAGPPPRQVRPPRGWTPRLTRARAGIIAAVAGAAAAAWVLSRFLGSSPPQA